MQFEIVAIGVQIPSELIFCANTTQTVKYVTLTRTALCDRPSGDVSPSSVGRGFVNGGAPHLPVLLSTAKQAQVVPRPEFDESQRRDEHVQ